jgi:hypothetical protein
VNYHPFVELQLCIWELNLEPHTALQLLHDGAVISDNVIRLNEIAAADIPNAINYLRGLYDITP